MVHIPNVNEIQTATAPQIDVLTLTTVVGDKIDLTPLFLSLDIYEDIFSHILTGKIIINDTLDLFSKIPICGQEKLTFKIYSKDYKPTSKINYLHRTFDIIRITDVIQVNDYTKSYTLHFASPEFKMSESFKLSKAFYDTTYSNVIATIMTEDFTLDRETRGFSFPTQNYTNRDEILSPYINENIEAWYNKQDDDDSIELFIEKTKYSEPVISFPFMKPFNIFSWLAARSLRESGGRYGTKNSGQAANFFFFENKRGFQFVSLDTLLESRDKSNVTTRFKYGSGNQNKETIREGNRIIYREVIDKIQIQNCYNIIANLRNGMYASRLYSYDLSTGETTHIDYNYIDNFHNTESTERKQNTGDYPPIPHDDEDLSRRYLAHQSFIVHSPTRGIDCIISEQTGRHSEYKENSTGSEEYIQKRLSQIARLNNFRVLFSIDGNSKHKVGDCVELDLKTWNDMPTSSQAIKDFNEASSKYYSGNYLITSIRHKITKYTYNMDIEVVKDAYKTKIGD